MIREAGSSEGAASDVRAENTRSPTVSVAVVNWNSGECLRDCLNSVAMHSPHGDSEVVLVDNGSSDESGELAKELLVRNAWPIPVRVILNSENWGFAAALNRAFQVSRAPFVLALNPDAEICEGTVEALLSAARSDSRIGACAPRILAADGSAQTNVWAMPPAAWRTIVEGLGLERLLPRPLCERLLLGPRRNHRRRRRVGAFSGAAFLVKRQTLEAVGGLDERFHMYGEDGEWCHRAGRHGWRLVYEPNAIVIHRGGQSARKRWGEVERRLREVDGFLQFEACCLSPFALVRNAVAHVIVLRIRATIPPADPVAAEVVRGSLARHQEALQETLASIVKRSARG